jgi:glycolate oxidase iron-sulfur subunit
MRQVEVEHQPVDDAFVRFMSTCVQCRGCEPACPSGVPFGQLIEGTRTSLAAEGRITPRWQRLSFSVLRHHRLLLAGSTLLAVAQRLGLVPKRLGLPSLPLRRGPAVASTGTDVWLFTGCVMDAWLRETHRSTAAVLAHLGVRYQTPSAEAACCGALHSHAGLHTEAAAMAQRVMRAMPGRSPIVVNSAGCGAALKDYGQLLGTSQAAEFSQRVVDVHEFVAPRIDDLKVARRHGAVAVQDPCHLRHVQRQHGAVRIVLSAVADVVELDDDGLCCGAGGAFAVLEPELATQIRDRKLAAIERCDARVVASANPGCAMHLSAAGVKAVHPIDLVAQAL